MRKEHVVHVAHVQLPLGTVRLAGTSCGICRLAFAAESESAFAAWLKRWWPDCKVRHDDAPFGRLQEQLKAYCNGRLRAFDVPLDLRATAFQRRVLERVLLIPFGQTSTYGQIAADLGDPKLARAVGAANGANPLPLLIPCHRVVGSDGSLVGFGGGMALKRQLLQLEGHGLLGNRLAPLGMRALLDG